MKLFGWGKRKDSQPQGRQQISKSDSRSGSYGLDRSSAMGSVMPPGKGSGTSMRCKQQGLFDSKGPSCSVDVEAESESEEKLQDKIRFVFSHEREGLLAIGTFALEQLQSIRNTIDGHQRGAAADPAAAAAAGNECNSAVNLLALDDDAMQSSDDEEQLQRSWLAARQVCDLPVFGDTFDDATVESDYEQAPSPGPATQNSTGVQQDECKALTIYKGNPNINRRAEKTPVFILAPELQSALKQPFLPHWTDSVPPPLIAKVNEPGPFVDNDYYSTRLCGLFNKKKSPRSKRMPLVPAATGDDGNRIIPIEKATLLESKKSSFLKLAAQGGAMPSLRNLAKLWKSSCTSSSARIAPERNSSRQLTPQVPPPCGPRGAEGRKRVQAHERMVDNQGHWIKDDEDCEFAAFLFNMTR